MINVRGKKGSNDLNNIINAPGYDKVKISFEPLQEKKKDEFKVGPGTAYQRLLHKYNVA
jgi:hypothetical protein